MTKLVSRFGLAMMLPFGILIGAGFTSVARAGDQPHTFESALGRLQTADLDLRFRSR